MKRNNYKDPKKDSFEVVSSKISNSKFYYSQLQNLSI